MLGIGSTELVLILFFGFLIFGPEKLPQMGSVVGRAIKQFRQASDDVNKKFKEEIYDPFQEAIDPYKSELEDSIAPLKDDLDSINQTFKETGQMFKDPLDLKGKREQLKNPLQAAREADAAKGSTAKKVELSAESKQAAASIRAQAAAMEADDSTLADPFAEPAADPAPKPSMAASLYGLDEPQGGDA